MNFAYKEPSEVCNCDLTLAPETSSSKVAPTMALNAKNDAKQLTPMRSIRHKCLDCSGGSYTEVKSCTVTGCALWPYRLGRRPAKGGDPCVA